MRTLPFHHFATIVVLLVACRAGMAAEDARARFTQRLPPDTMFAAFSQDVGASCAAFRQTGIGEALCGSDFAPLRVELAKREISSSLCLRPTYGFDWVDVVDVHDPGGFIVFQLPDGASGAAWLFTPAKPPESSPACLATAGRYFEKANYKHENAERQEAKLIVYTRAAASPGGASAGATTAVLFQTADGYGIANSLVAAEAIVLGGSKSIAWSLNEGGTPSDISLYVRPFVLWTQLTRESETSPIKSATKETGKEAASESPAAAAERLGYGAVKTVTATVRFSPDKATQWTIKAEIQADEPYQNALRILELRPGNLTPWPDWIGTDFDSAARWAWDAPLAMRGVGSLYDEATEPGPDGVGLFDDLLDGLRDDPEGVQVDLRRDVFAQLSPRILSVQFPGASADDNQRRLFIAGTRDMRKIQESLARFFKGDKRVQTRQADGFQMWTVDQGTSLFVESKNDNSVTVRGLAIGSEKLIATPRAELLDRATTPAARPKLSSDPGWNALDAWLGSQKNDRTAYESLVRLDRAAESPYVAAITLAKQIAPQDAKSADKQESPADGWVSAPSLQAWLWRVVLFGADDERARPFMAIAPKFDVLRAGLPQAGVSIARSEGGWTVQYGAVRATAKKAP